MVPVNAFDVTQRVGRGDRAVAEIAGGQHGTIHSEQLLAAGISHAAASGRAKRGTLHRIHRGVYRVGHSTPSLLSDLTAAILATGPFSAISHLAAGHLWRMIEVRPSIIDVSNAGKRRSRPGLQVHRLPTLGRPDLRARDGLPLTSPTLTVLDIAASAGRRQAERALDEGRYLKLITGRDLERLRERHPRRAGWGVLGAILSDERGPDYSRKEAERLLLALIRSAGLPEPRRNFLLHGYRLDVCWPELGLVVEIDGYASHGRRSSFERDRQRDADLTAAGITVVRFTWRQITSRRAWVAARLGAAIASAQTSSR